MTRRTDPAAVRVGAPMLMAIVGLIFLLPLLLHDPESPALHQPRTLMLDRATLGTGERLQPWPAPADPLTPTQRREADRALGEIHGGWMAIANLPMDADKQRVLRELPALYDQTDRLAQLMTLTEEISYHRAWLRSLGRALEHDAPTRLEAAYRAQPGLAVWLRPLAWGVLSPMGRALRERATRYLDLEIVRAWLQMYEARTSKGSEGGGGSHAQIAQTLQPILRLRPEHIDAKMLLFLTLADAQRERERLRQERGARQTSEDILRQNQSELSQRELLRDVLRRSPAYEGFGVTSRDLASEVAALEERLRLPPQEDRYPQAQARASALTRRSFDVSLDRAVEARAARSPEFAAGLERGAEAGALWRGVRWRRRWSEPLFAVARGLNNLIAAWLSTNDPPSSP